MTEINIERKERRSIWPWLLGLAIVLLVAMLLWNRNRDNTVSGVAADSAITNTSTGDVARDTTGGGRRP